jgi:autotransporter-associated beta strand protein
MPTPLPRAHAAPSARPRGRAALAPRLLALACLPLSLGAAVAGPFAIAGAETAAQTLGAGQAGSVAASGSLTVGGAVAAVTVSGSDATLDNLGTITQTGTGRAVRDNTGVRNLTINNGSAAQPGATLRTADGDVVQMNRSPASVVLNNYGRMTSSNASAGGNQVVDFNAIVSGANVVNNFATGVMTASEADAVRPGVNGAVDNRGIIRSTAVTGGGSDGIDAQSNTGVQVRNSGQGLIDGGRHGITGGPANAAAAFDIVVTNGAGATIRGSNGAGINIDGFNGRQTATIVNQGLIVGTGVTGDGDGIDIDGLARITNGSTGVIRSANAVNPPGSGPAFSEGLSIGGGTVTNAGRIEGLVAAGNANAVGRGITLAGNDIATGALAGTREGLYGDATITNQAGGLIRGQSDSAIVAVGAASGFAVAIQNDAGATLLGGGTANAAVKTGLDNDTLRNAGLIDGSSSGRAIDLGGGDNTLRIVGGQASVLGGIDGGVGGLNRMFLDPGAGGRFAYGGVISNFSAVVVESGEAVLSGASTYAGTTELRGGTLVLDGPGRLSSAGSLVLGGGALMLRGAAGLEGQRFARFSLLEDALIDLGASAMTFDALGAIAPGKTLTVLGWVDGGALDQALRFLGDLSADAGFLALVGQTQIDGARAAFRFDGTWTGIVRAAEVPEPGTLALLLPALAALAALRRRRADRAARD